MNIFETSLTALDKYLSNVSDDDFQQILDEVQAMNIEGPTVGEYFTFFSHNKPLRFKFQPGIFPHNCHVPWPQLSGFQIIVETPKFPLESFFCNIASWKMYRQPFLN